MQVIEAEIEPDERLLWSGRPKQGVSLRGSDIFMVPFSLLWCGFAIFWEYTAWSQAAPPFFLVFGGVFVCVGLYFVLGRFWWDSTSRQKTFYGITNDRVLIISGMFHKNVKSLNLRTLSDISLSEKSNGEGTISLGPTSFMDSMYGGMAWPGTPQSSPKFEGISEAKCVYKILREAQRG